MKNEEDEDDEVTIGVSRYPCLPSLVALQQMRNRLHMAHDGKRLMKWSAMATGRELRRIAEDIDRVFHQFYEDVKNCFILLARCRYFFHNFNRMVLESVAPEACVTVITTTKGVTGVRISLFETVESGLDPFPYLGVERGGETVLETKRAWLELLKRLIHILELRTSFMMIDTAHNNAQKKCNVLGKVIIPRTEATIHYILAELEELEREEFFRLKKVQEVKKKRSKKNEVKKLVCPICKTLEEKKGGPSMFCVVCKAPLHSDRKEKTPQEIRTEEAKKAKIKEQLKSILEIIKEYEQKGQASAVKDFKKTAEELQKKLDEPSIDQLPIPDDVNISKLCKACRRRVKPTDLGDGCPVCIAQAGEKAKLCVGCKAPLPDPTPPPPPKKLEIGKELNAIMDLTCKYEKNGIETASAADFKKIADQLRAKLKEASSSAVVCPNASQNKLCPSCSSTPKPKPKPPPPKPKPCPVLENKSTDPCPVCETFKKTMPPNCVVCNASLQEGPGKPKTDKRVEVREQLSSILKITAEYEQKGIESASIAEFKSIAEQLSEKLKKAPSLPNIPDSVDSRMLCVACKTRKEDQPVVEKKSSCRVVIREDVPPCRQRETTNIPCSMSDANVCSTHSAQGEGGSLHFLVDRIGDLIVYGKDFIARGLESLSLTDLVRTCETTKCQMQTFFDDEPGTGVSGDQDYEKLQCCVRHVIDAAKDLKADNAYTPSVEKFVATCHAVDTKLEDQKKKAPKVDKKRLEALKDHIDDVVQLTESYKSLGLEIPSIDKFIDDCAKIKQKIDEHTEEPVAASGHGMEIDHLKGHIAELEGLTNEINKEGLASRSFEDFIGSCKQFKTKLDQYKNRKPSNQGNMLKMIAQIDTAIGLSKEAKQEGLVSCSIDKFIKSCEDVKKRISKEKSGSKEKISPPTPPGILKDLKSNINVIIDLIKKFRKEGMVTPSVEKFLKYCEKAKAKIDEDAAAAANQVVCSEICNCAPKKICSTCQSTIEDPEPTPTSEGETYPCGHKVDQEPDVCGSCCTEDTETCGPCDEASSKEDTDLGYFEKKVRKIVRVTRTQNPDGTVKEEKETIIITQDMHDPNNENNLDDDDDDEYLGDMSYESLMTETDQEQDDQETCCSETPSKTSKKSKCCKDDDSKVRLILYTGTEANRRGFCRKSKSEGSTGRNPALASPKIRQCLSLAETDADFSREINYLQQNSVSSNFSHSVTPSDSSQNEPTQKNSGDARSQNEPTQENISDAQAQSELTQENISDTRAQSELTQENISDTQAQSELTQENISDTQAQSEPTQENSSDAVTE